MKISRIFFSIFEKNFCEFFLQYILFVNKSKTSKCFFEKNLFQ